MRSNFLAAKKRIFLKIAMCRTSNGFEAVRLFCEQVSGKGVNIFQFYADVLMAD